MLLHNNTFGLDQGDEYSLLILFLVPVQDESIASLEVECPVKMVTLYP